MEREKEGVERERRKEWREREGRRKWKGEEKEGVKREKEGEKGGVKGEKEGEGREKDPYFRGEYYEVGTQSSVNPRCPYFRESFKKTLQSPC